MDIVGNLLVCRVCGRKYDITPHVCNKDLLARHKEEGVYVYRCVDCGQHWLMRKTYEGYTGQCFGEWDEITLEQAHEYIDRIGKFGGEIFTDTPSTTQTS